MKNYKAIFFNIDNIGDITLFLNLLCLENSDNFLLITYLILI